MARQTPAASLIASHRALLGADDHGVTERAVGGRTELAYRGTPYATLRITVATDDKPAELEVRFVTPAACPELAAAAKHYRQLARPKGWTEFRQPLERDPGFGLRANLGTVIGAVKNEIWAAAGPAPLAQIESAGNFVVRSPVSFEFWSPGKDPVQTALASGPPRVVQLKKDRVAVVPGGAARVAIVVEPGARPALDGGVVYAPARADGATPAVPAKGWKKLGEIVLADDKPIWLHDATLTDREITERHLLEVRLAKGRYAFEQSGDAFRLRK